MAHTQLPTAETVAGPQERKVSIGYAGRAYAGTYSTWGSRVRVRYRQGVREGDLGCAAANPEAVAQVLLRELVHASSRAM